MTTLNAPNGDLDSQFGVAIGQVATVQMVVQHLRIRYGEYFARPAYGLPVLQNIVGQEDEAIVVEIVRRSVLEVPDVISVTNINANFRVSERILELSFDLTTIFSITAIPITTSLDLTGDPEVI